MLEIWGRPFSSNVIPVIWTAVELGLDFRLNLAGGSFGVLDTEGYEKLNPNRLIPTIRDDGFVLWESLAIVRYLCDRYGQGTLCPEDAQTRGKADQWMEWCGTRAFCSAWSSATAKATGCLWVSAEARSSRQKFQTPKPK